jgi:hypothetical protein
MPIASPEHRVQLAETASSALTVHRALLLVLALWFITAVNGVHDQSGQHHNAFVEAKSLERALFFLPQNRLSEIEKKFVDAPIAREMQQVLQSYGPSLRIRLQLADAMSGIDQLQDGSYKSVLDWTVSFLKAYPQAVVWTTIFPNAAFVDRKALVSAVRKCPLPALVRLTLRAGDPQQRGKPVLIAGEVVTDAVQSVSCGKFTIKAKQTTQWPEMGFPPLIGNEQYVLMGLERPDWTGLTKRESLFPYLSEFWSEISDKSPREATVYLAGKVSAEDKESDLLGFKLKESYIAQIAPVLISALLFYLLTHIWIIFRAPQDGLPEIGRGPYFGLGINALGWVLLALSLIVCPLAMLNFTFPTPVHAHFEYHPNYLFSVIMGTLGAACMGLTIWVAFKAK